MQEGTENAGIITTPVRNNITAQNTWTQVTEVVGTQTNTTSLYIKINGYRVEATPGTDMELLTHVCGALKLL
jgi:hypothetical protein